MEPVACATSASGMDVRTKMNTSSRNAACRAQRRIPLSAAMNLSETGKRTNPTI
jgi:hypothetical protein